MIGQLLRMDGLVAELATETNVISHLLIDSALQLSRLFDESLCTLAKLGVFLLLRVKVGFEGGFALEQVENFGVGPAFEPDIRLPGIINASSKEVSVVYHDGEVAFVDFGLWFYAVQSC